MPASALIALALFSYRDNDVNPITRVPRELGTKQAGHCVRRRNALKFFRCLSKSPLITMGNSSSSNKISAQDKYDPEAHP